MFKKLVFLAFTTIVGVLTHSYTRHAKATPNIGTVIKVYDGDTLTVKVQDFVYKIRLIGIDAPELKQQYGKQSKLYLEQLLLNKEIRLMYDKVRIDRYGRVLSYVYYDGICINTLMVLQGQAIVSIYPPNTAKHIELLEAEVEAKSKGLGVWNPLDPLKTKPKDYRKNKGAL